MSRRASAEQGTYVLLAAVTAAWLALSASSGPPFFRFKLFRVAGAPLGWILIGALGLALLRLDRLRAPYRSVRERLSRASPGARAVLAILLSLAFLALFLLLRSETVNGDGGNYLSMMRNYANRGLVCLLPDELLESYIHFRFLKVAAPLLGISDRFAYQLLSALSGAFFVFVLARFSRRLAPGSAPELFALVLSGGFVQLFFGEVEHYSLAATAILLYLYAGYGAAAGIRALAPAGAALALAMALHMLASPLLLSFAFLLLLSLRRKRYADSAAGAAAFLLVLGGVLFFLTTQGLTAEHLWRHSHGTGHGGAWRVMLSPWAQKDLLGYYGELFRVLFLLFPGVGVAAALLSFGRFRRSAPDAFLVLASVGMLGLMAVWNPNLGLREDWNLFAPCVIPLTVLCWQAFVRIDGLRGKERIGFALWALGALHAYSWIVRNHLGRR
jgi:hypothetical protein